MRKLPYIEPTIRSIAGTFITVFGVLIYLRPDMTLLWLGFLFFVSLNLFQSGFTSFCLMEKFLKLCGFRSEIAEIKSLSKVNADHLDTLNLLSEVVVELSPDGKLVRLTDSWDKLLGGTKNKVSACLGTHFTDYMHAEEHASLEQLISHLKEKEIEALRFRMLREDHSEHWIEGKFTLYSENRPQPVIRGVLRDVTEAYLQEQNISHMAMHDALTSLPNRVLLEDRMERAISQAKRSGQMIAILFIDLDNFKQVNDTHGHKAGDQLLIAISNSLKKSLRSSDTLARWGGDEFVVLLQGFQQVTDAYNIAEKLMAAVRNEVLVEHIDTLVTLSIGMAIFPDDADTSGTLLIQADKALFFAKSQGRNNIQMYSQLRNNNDLGFQEVDMTTRFSAAVKENAIQVYYQPVVDTQSERPVAFEALARWQDDKHGWVSPAVFIPMAENLGLMCEVGHQVMKQALHDFKEFLQHDPTLCMSVNVSNRQLFSPDFMTGLISLLEKNSISPAQLKLEITESIALLGIGKAKECLRELSNAGFYLSIDDFGTGFSSLSYLHEFPVNELKIDISFVRRIHTEDGHVMVKTIVDMGHAMKLQLVAEGVENPETAKILHEMGVEGLQGYNFSRPLPKDECLKLLGKRLPVIEQRP